MSNCNEEEFLNSSWKCQDNQSFFDNNGEEYSLNDKQSDKFSYALINAQIFAIKSSNFGQKVVNYFNENIRPFSRVKLSNEKSGHLKLLAPGIKEKEESDWNISLKPAFMQINSSVGWHAGFSLEANFFSNFSVIIVWEDNDNAKYANIRYSFSKNHKLNFSAKEEQEEDKFWIFYTFQF